MTKEDPIRALKDLQKTDSKTKLLRDERNVVVLPPVQRADLAGLPEVAQARHI